MYSPHIQGEIFGVVISNYAYRQLVLWGGHNHRKLRMGVERGSANLERPRQTLFLSEFKGRVLRESSLNPTAMGIFLLYGVISTLFNMQCLFVFQQHTFLITQALRYTLKSRSVMSAVLFYVLNIALSIWNLMFPYEI